MYSFDKNRRVTGPGVDFSVDSAFEAVTWCERLEAAYRAGARSRRGKRKRDADDRARLAAAGIRRPPPPPRVISAARRNEIAVSVLESLESGNPKSVRELRLAARCKHDLLFEVLQLLVNGGAVAQRWWGMRPAGYRITNVGEQLIREERERAAGTPDQAGA